MASGYGVLAPAPTGADAGLVKRLFLTTLVLALATSACSILPSPAVLVFHNRSDARIALYPDVIIEPCSTMEFDGAAIDQGKARSVEAVVSDEGFDAWVPAGAVQFQAGIPGRRIGATEPLTVVVSALPIRIEEHRLAPAELPDCGGDPVGIQYSRGAVAIDAPCAANDRWIGAGASGCNVRPRDQVQ